MSKKRSPAFQFYAADYLADEKVQLMSIEEEGCYIRLLCYCFREKSIPAEPEKLARLCKGVTPSEAVIGCFRECEGYPNRLAHPRLEEERLSKLEFAEKCKQWGKLGAHKRKGNKEKSTERVGLAGPSLKKSSSSSSSSSSNNNLSNDRLLDGATRPTPAEVFTELPCTGKTKSWPVTKSYVAEMAPLYPGIDVGAEILRAKGWLLNNPQKRKTAVGMTRFLGSWFAREQDKVRAPTLPVRVAPDLYVGASEESSSASSECKQAMIEIECEDDPARKAQLLEDYKRKFETESEVA